MLFTQTRTFQFFIWNAYTGWLGIEELYAKYYKGESCKPIPVVGKAIRSKNLFTHSHFWRKSSREILKRVLIQILQYNKLMNI